MGRDAFKPKHASSVSISGVIDTGVNSNVYLHPTINLFYYSLFYSGKKVPFIRKTEKYCEYNITVSPLIVYLIVMVSHQLVYYIWFIGKSKGGFLSSVYIKRKSGIAVWQSLPKNKHCIFIQILGWSHRNSYCQDVPVQFLDFHQISDNAQSLFLSENGSDHRFQDL